jgi:hypothetical protein
MSDEELPSRPALRVVSSQTDAEIDRERLVSRVQADLRVLTANLFRVARGAGRPYDIVRDVDRLNTSLSAHWDALQMWPSSYEFSRAIDVALDREDRRGLSDEAYSEAVGLEYAIRGSLQIAASRLMGQATQERRGESELYDGFREMRRLREERLMAELQSAHARLARAQAKTKKKPKPKPGPKAP